MGLGRDLTHPFEVDPATLREHIDQFIDVTIGDLGSEFLLLPRGSGFIEYEDFRDAYEVLKRHTAGFGTLSHVSVYAASAENSRVLGVVRAMLGMTPGEWADLARAELRTDVDQRSARLIDRDCRSDPGFVGDAISRGRRPVSLARVQALISAAVKHLADGAPARSEGIVHRLDKFDTRDGMELIRYAATEDVPYAVVLYERYLGRPFASHRDAVSESLGRSWRMLLRSNFEFTGLLFARPNARSESRASAKRLISVSPMRGARQPSSRPKLRAMMALLATRWPESRY